MGRDRQRRRWDQPAIGNHRSRVRLQFSQLRQESFIANRVRLQYRDVGVISKQRDRRAGQFLATPSAGIGAGQDRGYLVTGGNKALQRRNRCLWCASEDESHGATAIYRRCGAGFV